MSFLSSCRCLLLLLFSIFFINALFAQCPDGDEVTFGQDSWDGYVYDGVNTFDSPNYLGLITRPTTFVEPFCVDNCNFLTDAGCPVNSETFSIRFKNQQTLACGRYTFTVGSDYGIKFSLNGGSTYLINIPSSGSYLTYSTDVFLTGGTYDMILEYVHNTGVNQVEFGYSVVLDDYAGSIAGDQTICSSPIDPSAFTSVAPAVFCSGEVPQYQWEESTDNIDFDPIPGAIDLTYDVPSGLTAGSHYYRRTATDGVEIEISNVITILADSPEGVESFYPSNTWRGYVYDGSQNYSASDYRGYFDIPTPEFTNYDFCGSDACLFSLNGCDIVTENFSVRLRSEQTFACAAYQVSVSGDDGVRLFIDGTELTNGYTTAYSEAIFLNGTHQFVIEYFDVSGPNTLSFDTNLVGTESGGIISSSQTICANPINPAPFTSVQSAGFCTGTITYQWEQSPDGVSNWVDILTATSETYDIPSGMSPGVTYYRRRATNGTSTLYSNVISVTGDMPFGDQNTFGVEDWIGYVYLGVDNFTTNYRGFYTESNNVISPGVEGFDQNFGGSSTSFPLGANGCDFNTTSFSVRYKSTQDFSANCGAWQITIGGDDGVRLYIDGVLAIDGYSLHSYLEFSNTFYLFEQHEFILEYYESAGDNRVSFRKTRVADGIGGVIGGSQVVCDDPPADPAAFTNVTSAQSCDPVLYQWEEFNGGSWDPIPGATLETYDPPAGQSVGIHSYRRRAEDGTNVFYSNTVTAEIDPPQGDGVTPGDDSWIGYVYDGIDNYSTDYQGYITQPLNFDESFCGSNCIFPINGCDIVTQAFSIQFLNTQTFTCGTYQFTIGGDDGVRLYIDGVLEIDGSGLHPYTTYTETIFLSGGEYDLVLEYYDNAGGNRVSFNATFLGAGDGGAIGSNQVYCSASADPLAFTSTTDASFCSPAGPTVYQWQESVDGIGWSNISGANSNTYDPPTVSSTRYFRRRATDGVTTLNSNVITVTITGSPSGDPNVYGTDQWIGYVFSGRDNYDPSDYLGFITEPPIFDEQFCVTPSSVCTVNLPECSFVTTDFSVRFRMIYDFPAANYTFTIGGDDGVRLYVDGNFYLAAYSPYTEYTGATIFLSGPTELILDYFEGAGANLVSFDYTSTPLPVTWYYFDGYHKNGINILEWQTASEINNVGFDVERSLDGKTFEKVGWVGGHGTSNQNHQYTFTDSLPKLGWNYYRLKQTDYDGKYEYSRLIPIYVDEIEEIQIYPNPLRDHIYLSRVDKDAPIEVTITNVVAQRTYILQQDPMQPARFAINERLTPGVYSVRIKMDDKVYQQKVIVE